MMTTLVVDDEPLARRALATMIATRSDLRQVGEATDGTDAIDMIRRLAPDLVFLDISLPEMDGLTVVRHLRSFPSPPLLIFTTAYDDYAVAAFELHALDYLLKPFGQNRFNAAVQRAADAADLQLRARAIGRADQALLQGDGQGTLQRIFVRDGASIRQLAIAEIVRVEAQDDYAALHTDRRIHLVSVRIGDLEASLPKPPFLRVHRSHIVNLDHVDRFERDVPERMTVLMRDGKRVPVSRTRACDIRRVTR